MDDKVDAPGSAFRHHGPLAFMSKYLQMNKYLQNRESVGWCLFQRVVQMIGGKTFRALPIGKISLVGVRNIHFTENA